MILLRFVFFSAFLKIVTGNLLRHNLFHQTTIQVITDFKSLVPFSFTDQFINLLFSQNIFSPRVLDSVSLKELETPLSGYCFKNKSTFSSFSSKHGVKIATFIFPSFPSSPNKLLNYLFKLLSHIICSKESPPYIFIHMLKELTLLPMDIPILSSK